jgi:hypothetical protein
MPNPLIFDFENAVMSASYEVLTTAGIVTVDRQRDSDEKTTPRVELQAIMGAPTGHVHISGSQNFLDSYSVTLQAYVVTERSINNSEHNTIRNTVIEKLTDGNNMNSGSLMPYHHITICDFGGSQVSTDQESNYDMTGITFNLQVWVKPSVW